MRIGPEKMKKFLLGSSVFILAFGVLSVSFLRLSTPSFASSDLVEDRVLGVNVPQIEYSLPYAGGVLPDNTFWIFKALRDKVWYVATFDQSKRSDLNLLFSDKRLIMSEELFNKKKPDLGLSTLTKGEKYLESASFGLDNVDFARKLAIASLKHRQIIEEDILPIAPDDLKPGIIKSMDWAKNTYKVSRDYLNSKGEIPPKNPFND